MHTFTLKNLGLLLAFIIGGVGLSPESFGILTVFIAIDSITGIIRAGILHGWRSVTSSRFVSGIMTKLVVVIVPLVIAWAGRGAGIDLLLLAKGTLSALILAESYSILGNVHAIRTREDIEEFDAIAFILTNVRESVEKLFSNQIKK